MPPLITTPTSIITSLNTPLQGGRFLVIEDNLENRVIGPFTLINGITNNFNPLNWDEADVILLNPTYVSQLSGVQAPSGPRRSVKRLVNAGSGDEQSIILLTDDVGSLLENRFTNNTGDNIGIYMGNHAVITYDFVGLGWFMWNSSTGYPIEVNFALVADINPLTFSGVVASDIIRVTASAPGFNIRGLDSTFLGTVNLASTKEIKTIYNVGVNSFTVTNNDAGAAANERILIPGSVDALLQPGDSLTVWFDFDDEIWRVIG